MDLISDIKREREQELIQEHNEEVRNVWIQENYQYLAEEFAENNDEFDAFCREAYSRVEE